MNWEQVFDRFERANAYLCSREKRREVVLRQRKERQQKRQAEREAWERKRAEWREKEEALASVTIMCAFPFDPTADDVLKWWEGR